MGSIFINKLTMDITNIPYRHLENFVLRSSSLSLNFFFNLTKDKTISDEDFKKAWKNKLIQEDIYLASPTLYFELNKCVKGDEIEIKDIFK